MLIVAIKVKTITIVIIIEGIISKISNLLNTDFCFLLLKYCIIVSTNPIKTGKNKISIPIDEPTKPMIAPLYLTVKTTIRVNNIRLMI